MTELFDQTVIDPEPSRQTAVAEAPGDPMTPLALIRQAVELGLGPEQLKALVDLQEQVRASRARELFAAAMTACQAELPNVVRDAENTHTKKLYASLEVVQRVAKPVTLKHGFALSFSEADCQTPNFKRTVCKVRHSAGHSEDHFLDLPVDKSGSMNAVQGAVSTGSYGQRVLTCRIFNITIAETDRDGRADPHPNPEANQNAPKAAPRGQRQQAPINVAEKPAPDATNQHGVKFEDVNQVIAKWKKDNPSLKTDGSAFSHWASQVAERELTAVWGEWNKRDLAKCRDALGILSDGDIPF